MKKETWCIPVLTVTHPKKQKVKLVFDSSAKFQDTSLNDMFLSGPDLINRLKTVLIRFRKARVGFAADIESMFYCFVLDEKDRDKTRFFWFAGNCPSAELVEYRGTCHLFGNTSSPAFPLFYQLTQRVTHLKSVFTTVAVSRKSNLNFLFHLI